MDCEDVRDRLLRLSVGLGGGAGELRRHLAGCAACRREADLLRDILGGMAAEGERVALLEAFDMEDLTGSGTFYVLNAATNPSDEPAEEWWFTTMADPDAFTLFDTRGRPLAETRRRRHSDGRWFLHYRLHEPWPPRAEVRVLSRWRHRLQVRPSGDGWTAAWCERPLAHDDVAPEALYRLAVRLPSGYRATGAHPQPDHAPVDPRLLTWSAVVPRAEAFAAEVTFERGVLHDGLR